MAKALVIKMSNNGEEKSGSNNNKQQIEIQLPHRHSHRLLPSMYFIGCTAGILPIYFCIHTHYVYTYDATMLVSIWKLVYMCVSTNSNLFFNIFISLNDVANSTGEVYREKFYYRWNTLPLFHFYRSFSLSFNFTFYISFAHTPCQTYRTFTFLICFYHIYSHLYFI